MPKSSAAGFRVVAGKAGCSVDTEHTATRAVVRAGILDSRQV